SIDRIDGVLYTHAHADHIFGLDDLRRFNAMSPGAIDLYAEDLVSGTLRSMFRYIFEPHSNVNQSFIPTVVIRKIEAGGAFDLQGWRWTPLRFQHGQLPVLGFRVDYPGSGGGGS